MGWFQKVIYGVDLDAEQARQNDLDKRLQAENQRDLENGTFTQDVFDEAERNRQASYIADVSGQVSDAFNSGLAEGVDNIRNAAGSALSRPIPWQVWALGAVALLWYTGLLRGLFKGR